MIVGTCSLFLLLLFVFRRFFERTATPRPFFLLRLIQRIEELLCHFPHLNIFAFSKHHFVCFYQVLIKLRVAALLTWFIVLMAGESRDPSSTFILVQVSLFADCWLPLTSNHDHQGLLGVLLWRRLLNTILERDS